MEKERSMAIVIFTHEDGSVAFQSRGKHSKVGEKYGFFGGGIEEGESSDAALERELTEELGYVPESFEFWKSKDFVLKDKGTYYGWKIHEDIYLSPITKKLKKSEILEGDEVVIMPINGALELEGLHPEDAQLLRELKEFKGW